jgi:hypothetical protein
MFEINKFKQHKSWMWRYIPVIPALKKLKQEDRKFEANSETLSQQNKTKTA